MKKFGIYVHIPFCKKKCKYCDFISFSCFEEKEDVYVNALIKEIEYRKTIDQRYSIIDCSLLNNHK